MSMPQELGAEFANALNGAEANPAEVATPNVPDSSAPNDSSGTNTYDPTGLSPYVQNWVAQFPENERPTAAKYAREWDTKGFQPYAQAQQARLQPYVELGSPDELRQVKGLVEQLKADPQGFVQALIDNGFYTPGPAPQQAPGVGQVPNAPQYFDAQGNPVQLPAVPQAPDIASHPQFKRMEQALGALAQQTAAQQQAARAAQEDAALEQVMVQAEQKYGKFDRYTVYNLMAQGQLTVDAAVQQWRNIVSQYAQEQKPAPNVMGASSAPPAAPGPLTSSDDRANALAQWLSAQNQ